MRYFIIFLSFQFAAHASDLDDLFGYDSDHESSSMHSSREDLEDLFGDEPDGNDDSSKKSITVQDYRIDDIQDEDQSLVTLDNLFGAQEDLLNEVVQEAVSVKTNQDKDNSKQLIVHEPLWKRLMPSHVEPIPVLDGQNLAQLLTLYPLRHLIHLDPNLLKSEEVSLLQTIKEVFLDEGNQSSLEQFEKIKFTSLEDHEIALMVAHGMFLEPIWLFYQKKYNLLEQDQSHLEFADELLDQISKGGVLLYQDIKSATEGVTKAFWSFFST